MLPRQTRRQNVCLVRKGTLHDAKYEIETSSKCKNLNNLGNVLTEN